jgi:hypothetical protein
VAHVVHNLKLTWWAGRAVQLSSRLIVLTAAVISPSSVPGVQPENGDESPDQRYDCAPRSRFASMSRQIAKDLTASHAVSKMLFVVPCRAIVRGCTLRRSVDPFTRSCALNLKGGLAKSTWSVTFCCCA